MSGVDKKSIDVLQGAGFSGELKGLVRMDIAHAVDEQSHGQDGTRSARIVYTFDRKRYGSGFVGRGKNYA